MANTYLQNVQIVGAEALGTVQALNVGKSDDSTVIYYELQTQEIEFDNRAHLKNISDKIVVLTEFGTGGRMETQENDGNFETLSMTLNDSVNIGQAIDLKGNYFIFKWSGESSESSPRLKGIYLENVTDLGLTYE